ncbi:MAG: hydrolase [Propionibacteriales bacterium]|nr:hydrolase [Propionibacteriales bacterium]
MSTITIDTPDGPAELVLDEADEPAAVLLLGHGAGGDIDSWDLALLADRLPTLGVSVARFRQPYRVAGRKIFSSAPGLDRAWQLAVAEVSRQWPGLPLFVGGRSAGARTACRGYATGQSGLVLLAFPLHPPGKPDKSRLGELLEASAPTLIVQGEKDTFGTPDQVAAALAETGRSDVRLVAMPGAGHTLAPKAKATVDEVAEAERLLVWSVAAFLNEQGS